MSDTSATSVMSVASAVSRYAVTLMVATYSKFGKCPPYS